MKLVQTKKYLLLIDLKNKPNLGDFAINQEEIPNTIIKVDEDYFKVGFEADKLLAYYPLTKEAKELDLPLLPPFEEEIDMEELFYDNCKNLYDTIEEQNISKLSFYKGYKAAQSKQFSLEDILRLAELLYTNRKKLENLEISLYDIIQSLSTQQLPKEFILEYEKEIIGEVSGTVYIDERIKIITNSEGKEEIQGTYKY